MPSRGDGPRRTNRVPITMAAFPRSSRSIRREAAHRALARTPAPRPGGRVWVCRDTLASSRARAAAERPGSQALRGVGFVWSCRFVPTFVPAGRSRSAARIFPWVRASATVAGAQSPHSAPERVSRGDPQTQSVWEISVLVSPCAPTLTTSCSRGESARPTTTQLGWRSGSTRAPATYATRMSWAEAGKWRCTRAH
jgi:hypothetical protein